MCLLSDGVRFGQGGIGIGNDFRLRPQFVTDPTNANSLDIFDSGHGEKNAPDVIDQRGINAVHESAVNVACSIDKDDEHNYGNYQSHDCVGCGPPDKDTNRTEYNRE